MSAAGGCESTPRSSLYAPRPHMLTSYRWEILAPRAKKAPKATRKARAATRHDTGETGAKGANAARWEHSSLPRQACSSVDGLQSGQRVASLIAFQADRPGRYTNMGRGAKGSKGPKGIRKGLLDLLDLLGRICRMTVPAKWRSARAAAGLWRPQEAMACPLWPNVASLAARPGWLAGLRHEYSA